jgi:lipopolysaccharide export system permease protein
VLLYIEHYQTNSQTGHNFFLEKYNNQHLVSRLTASEIEQVGKYHWRLTNYIKRDFNGMYETIKNGPTLDTLIQVDPSEFNIVKGWSEQLTTPELRTYLNKQKERGVANIEEYNLEYTRRFSFPFSCFILTLIGVSLASRRVRGGMGLHLGLGLLISFTYILLDTVSGSFAQGTIISPGLSVWIPNILYAIIGYFLYRKAPK